MTTSAYTTILSSVKSVIDGLTLDDTPAIRIRKQPVVGVDDTLPLILVCPEQEHVEDETSEGVVLIRYPVLVFFAYRGNQLLETDVAKLLDMRQAIRQALHKPGLTGATTVIDTNIELDPPFDADRYPAELDVSGIRFFFLSQELRSV